MTDHDWETTEEHSDYTVFQCKCCFHTMTMQYGPVERDPQEDDCDHMLVKHIMEI